MELKIPVITVVSVMGTTEESAVDPLTDILDLRDKFRQRVSIEPSQLVSTVTMQTV